jgi:hypothetical protein
MGCRLLLDFYAGIITFIPIITHSCQEDKCPGGVKTILPPPSYSVSPPQSILYRADDALDINKI